MNPSLKANRARLLQAVVEATCRHYACDWREVMTRDPRRRGRPEVARARMVAQAACVMAGVPIAVTAQGFRRTRRTIHGAMVSVNRLECMDPAFARTFRQIIGQAILSLPPLDAESGTCQDGSPTEVAHEGKQKNGEAFQG